MKNILRPIVIQCDIAGCLRIDKGGKCYGWKDPGYMWEQFGRCPHVLTDAEEAERLYG